MKKIFCLILIKTLINFIFFSYFKALSVNLSSLLFIKTFNFICLVCKYKMEEALSQALQQQVISLMIQGQLKACSRICINKPGPELIAVEKQCLAMCQDRYQEVFQKTFFRQYQTFMKKLEAESGSED